MNVSYAAWYRAVRLENSPFSTPWAAAATAASCEALDASAGRDQQAKAEMATFGLLWRVCRRRQ